MLNARIESWAGSSSSIPRALASTVRAAGHLRRFVLNPRVRAENITRVLYPDHHLQPATFSEPNRYPELFAACKSRLADTPEPAILSFGCATGEEAFALAAYLPNASITGVDLNRWCIRQARRANHNPRIRFLHSLSSEVASLVPFDAIFAMAVFQHSENRNNTAPVAHRSLPFDKFSAQIARLDARLKPGGLFFIDHADFRFSDTPTAARYTPLDFPANAITHDRPLFDADNRLIATHYTLPRAFRKVSAS